MADNAQQDIEVRIKINGLGDLQTFTNLSIQQSLADVCSGSFGYREDGKTTLQHQVGFYQSLMGQDIDVTIHEGHTFKGFITSVYLHNENEEASEYIINFEGAGAKLNHHRECNSWTDKTLNKIIKEVAGNAPLDLDDKDSASLPFSVQYNQSNFAYIRMMAIRHGKWLYYDGQRIKMTPPKSAPIIFQKGESIFDISIMARNSKGHDQFTAYDVNTGRDISISANVPPAVDFAAVAFAGANNALIGHQTSRYIPVARDEAGIKDIGDLEYQSAHAGAVILQATTYNPSVKLGSVIRINESDGSAGKDYIVTQLSQSISHPHNYTNFITFIPADVTVPPYTNAAVFTQAPAQPARVKENVDTGGIDRLRVHFPWMKPAEMTDWISMVTAYAGKNKGMRFLPEKEEEVLVDFIGGNVEKPFIVGAIYTETNKSGYSADGNVIKAISTGSGRRFEINDGSGTLKVYDNEIKATPKNGLLFTRKDEETTILLESMKDKDNYSVIAFRNEEHLNLGLMNGGALVAEIRLEKDGKKITIKSEGSIDLTSGSINLNAENISITASKKLKLEGTKEGTALTGKSITVEGKTNSSIKGVDVTIEATGTLKLQGGPVAILAASLVKIN